MSEQSELEISKMLQSLAVKIGEELEEAGGEPIGFCLVTFPTDAESRKRGGFVNYVSNCARTNVIVALAELTEHWKSGARDTPAHKRH